MLYNWTVKDIVEVIEGCIQNKFDFVCFVEGKRGVGKSTLVYKIAERLGRRGVVKFSPKHSIVYSREDTLRMIASKERWVIFSDEMINVTYKRDFYEQQQKQIIKGLNMYRDSCNVFFGAVPLFKNLDSDMKELCKMKLSVLKRGVAEIRIQPNFMDVLKSQERGKRGRKRFELKIEPTRKVGMVIYKDITKLQRREYERIKKEKRGQVFNEESGITDPVADWYKRLYDQLIKGELTKDSFFAICNMADKKPTSVRTRLHQMLRDDRVGKTVGQCFKEINKVKSKRDSAIERYKNL